MATALSSCLLIPMSAQLTNSSAEIMQDEFNKWDDFEGIYDKIHEEMPDHRHFYDSGEELVGTYKPSIVISTTGVRTKDH
jgi:hypothetical protein